MRHVRYLVVGGLMALLVLAIGCKGSSINISSAGVPIGGTSSAGITVSANPTSISTHGIASITATLNVADGTAVTFSLSPSATVGTTTMGSLSATSATTAGGVARVIFTASNGTGAVTIYASSGTLSGSVPIIITASATSAVSVSASPNTLVAGNTSTITVTVVDTTGNPVADNTSVSFSLGNTLAATLSASSAFTTNGIATVTLLATSAQNASETVTAAVGSITGKVTITITGGSGGIITVTASPTSLVENGFSTSAITANVTDSSNNPLTNVQVSFSLSNNTEASLSATSATTDALGNALVTLTTGTANPLPAPVLTITASAFSGSLSGSTTVNLSVPSGSGSLTLAATPSSMITSSSASVAATVLDNSGNPVSGVTVNFALSPSIASFSTSSSVTSTSAVTNLSGVGTVTVYSGSIAAPIQVTASTAGLPNASATITISPAPPASVNVAVNPTTITVLGTATITATVKDVNGNPVPDGTMVTFSLSPATTYGTLSSSVASTASGNGTATTTLVASSTAGTVTITATAGSVTSTTALTIVPAAVASIQFVSASPQTIGIQGGGQTATSTVKFEVLDVNGNPASDGTAVSFTLLGPGGGEYIGPLDATPDAATGATVNGYATTILTSGSVAGPCTVIASTSINNLNNVTNLSGAIGASDTIIPVTLGGTTGFPVSGRIKIDNELIDYTGTTTSSFTGCTRGVFGTASASHISGATVYGQSTVSSSATQISIGGGLPSAGHWNITVSKINLQGLKYSGLTSTVTAFIADRFGNANVLQGTTVSFNVKEGGAFTTSNGVTNASGLTSVTFRTQAPSPTDVMSAMTTTNVYGVNDYSDFAGYFLGLNEPWLPVGPFNSNPRDGWVTALATTMGEEGFLDENGNGMFDLSYSTTPCPFGYTCECDGGIPNGYAGCVTTQINGPTCTFSGNTCPAGSRSEAFIDQGEPFYDNNDNGKRDDGSQSGSGLPLEEFIDTNGNFIYDGPNGVWDGPECKSPGCKKSKMIWTETKFVFSGGALFYPYPDANNCYGMSGGCTATWVGGAPGFAVAPVSITRGTTGSFMVIVGDLNLNLMGGGTSITATADVGTVTNPSSYTVVDQLSTGPTKFGFGVSISPTEPKTQTNVTVTVTAPDGIKTIVGVTVPIL